MSMTKKDFETVAWEINRAFYSADTLTEAATIAKLTDRLALTFHQSYPNFDIDKFYAAAITPATPERFPDITFGAYFHDLNRK